MAVVTVTGAGRSVTIPFQSAEQALIAQSLATAISSQLAAGTLKPVTAVGPIAPTGTTPEALFIQSGGVVVLNPSIEAVIVNAPGSLSMLGNHATN